MRRIEIAKQTYRVVLSTDAHSLSVTEGNFFEMRVAEAPLFSMRVRRVGDTEEMWIHSNSYWKNVTATASELGYRLIFCDPCDLDGIEVCLDAEIGETGISWTGSVRNESAVCSVMEIAYPTLTLEGERFDLFVPKTSGIVITDAGKKGFQYRGGQSLSMQYFAVYGTEGGLYYGIHDPAPALKQYDIEAGEDKATLSTFFVGVNGLRPKNSFSLAGRCVWQALRGDWYDASLIYADFVRKEAEWIPVINENGRPDTAEKWKDIPFWVCDYIPNSEEQGENRPMSLAAGSDRQTPSYWYEAVIELQKTLNVPIGYHVYNWHEIPFNVDYPHFLPAKQVFFQGMERLKAQDGIFVTPYINALSWETRDDFGARFDMTFENTGRRGAVKLESGELKEVAYPQTHGDGKQVMLAYMCPTDPTWQRIVRTLSREMEETLPIDGIYFDQIAASHGRPCYDETHGHPTGGGRYWCDGYREMMREILEQKPKEAFYFSEDNTEEYMNLFDGFLTWRWLMSEEVPAFSVVYAGYILTLGRSTLGVKKDDTEFFKYSMAQSFLYGQLLGWCKADVLYDPERMPFLTTLVRERYRCRRWFLGSDMLRPPKVSCSLEAKRTTPALTYKTEVVMEQVLAGAWRRRTDGKVILFVINLSTRKSQYRVSFSAEEYGLSKDELAAKGFSLEDGNYAVKEGLLGGESILTVEF